jgi:chemosensory pili system protein ChpC
MSTTPDSSAREIRGVLIQVQGERLLLPNAAVAEVLSFSPPDALEGAPDWLLGSIRWRGWQMPLVAFSHMAGIAEEQGGLGSKVVVLKALGGNPKAPYFAVLTQGFPRLVTVPRDELLAQDDGEALPDGVLARVMLREDSALVPDLMRIEARIQEGLQQAA